MSGIDKNTTNAGRQGEKMSEQKILKRYCEKK